MNFKNELFKIAQEYQLSNYNKFNIFKVMFKLHDEKYLHSRFIAFLLDPNGSHKQGTLFLEQFFEVMKISNFKLEKVKVNPTETDRREVHNIDILIKNNHNQAIIIENKVFAKDQTKIDDQTLAENPLLKYQLTRYYSKLVENQSEVTKIIYLTIDGKDPEDFDKFPEVVKNLISKKDHLSDISKWLDLCIAQLTTDSDLKRSIEQYQLARFEFLNDVQLALTLKNTSAKAEYINDAFKFWTYKQSIDSNLQEIKKQFIHVKWHTVHEFYTELNNRIQETFSVAVSEISNEEITKLTHYNQKKTFLLSFNYEGTTYYVCNDAQGFSIGRHVEPKTENDFKLLFDSKYAFFDFSQFKVFQLIDPNESKKLIHEIVTEMKNFIQK